MGKSHFVGEDYGFRLRFYLQHPSTNPMNSHFWRVCEHVTCRGITTVLLVWLRKFETSKRKVWRHTSYPRCTVVDTHRGRTALADLTILLNYIDILGGVKWGKTIELTLFVLMTGFSVIKSSVRLSGRKPVCCFRYLPSGKHRHSYMINHHFSFVKQA